MLPFEDVLKHRDVAELWVRDKLARQCSYMHSKTFVAQVEALTGRKFDWFKLPPNVILRPVGVGEIRVILPSGEAAVCNEETGDVVHIAMPSFMVNHPFPCLTSLTDRSGILSSLLHHLAHVGFLVPFFFGFVHALFNDMKLSARHSSEGAHLEQRHLLVACLQHELWPLRLGCLVHNEGRALEAVHGFAFVGPPEDPSNCGGFRAQHAHALQNRARSAELVRRHGRHGQL